MKSIVNRSVRTCLLLLSAVSVLGVGSRAGAAIIGLNLVGPHDDATIRVWQSSYGAEWTPYRVTVYDDSSLGIGHDALNQVNPETDFLTFCVENAQYFSASGSTFDLISLSTKTNNTNYYLSGYSAWVYNTFRLRYGDIAPSTLPSFINSTTDLFQTVTGTAGTTSTTLTRSDLFQFAIWGGMLKNNPQTASITDLGSLASEYQINAATWDALGKMHLSVADFQNSGWGGLDERHGYQVMNFFVDNTWGQDQLLPTPTPYVTPEPSTLITWIGLALFGSYTVRRGWLTSSASRKGR